MVQFDLFYHLQPMFLSFSSCKVCVYLVRSPTISSPTHMWFHFFLGEGCLWVSTDFSTGISCFGTCIPPAPPPIWFICCSFAAVLLQAIRIQRGMFSKVLCFVRSAWSPVAFWRFVCFHVHGVNLCSFLPLFLILVIICRCSISVWGKAGTSVSLGIVLPFAMTAAWPFHGFSCDLFL